MRKGSVFDIAGPLGMAMSFGLLVFIGCGTQMNMLPTAEHLAVGGFVPPAADKGALQRGRALATTECSSCHRFYWPHEYSPDEWPGIARKMGERASLSEEQISDVSAYFVAASRAASESGP